jgi:hypothetical protein
MTPDETRQTTEEATAGGEPRNVRELLDARRSDARVCHVAAVVAALARALGWTEVADPLDGLAHELAALDGWSGRGEAPLNPAYRSLLEAWCERDGAHALLRELTEQAAFGYRWTAADEDAWAKVVERLLDVVERASKHALSGPG